jgi:aminoglycoside 3-N-acetyltransferase
VTTFVRQSSIADDLRKLGLQPGDTVLVHASLRSLGYVVGGSTAAVRALLDVVGPAGTIVSPAYTPENRDPSRWTDPIVPVELWAQVRESIPAFDPRLSPSAGVGVVAERIRTWPGAVRSEHPQTSFAAIGARAADLMAGHALESPLGEKSPLARLAESGAVALLLGVGYDRCTTFHLAEYRLPDPRCRPHGCAIAADAGRKWITFDSVDLDSSDFVALGAEFQARRPVSFGQVGGATATLVPMDEAVAFAVEWFRCHRGVARDIDS